MKFIVSIFLLFFLSDGVFGQKYPQSLIDSLCNETIATYYNDILATMNTSKSDELSEREIFILKSELTHNLKTKFQGFTIHYVTQQEAFENISMTNHRTGSLQTIVVSQVSDTVNVDVGGWAVTVTKVKFIRGKPTGIHANMAASCGGTMGYIPTCRFIYSNVTNSWTKLTRPQIVEMEINESKIPE